MVITSSNVVPFASARVAEA
uniref:TSA n=1 Tax=Arundo donax TaxID=35708 RepID=A0A0A9F3F4_ARUDO